MTALSGIADYLRVRREAAGLTRSELSRRAGVSEALIQKIEQGTRQPTSNALGALFTALDVPVQVREHAATLLQPELASFGTEITPPEPYELDFLRGLPHPACYQTMPAVDLVAANDAYLRAFPGLEPGDVILEWMLLDPRAREVMADWERDAHLMVYGFRYLAPAIHAPEKVRAIIERCSAAPEWNRFWNTDIPSDEIEGRRTRVHSPDTGELVTYHIQVFKFELPQRPWWIYSLVPAN
ncbi:helix-turn-helix domain-containing protein [Nocardia sp. CDC160]|uniref:helix-turn-helix domain-containing protein n=1 Tax=Nocardia sp. CDC160 TaxID=3112166 RepID=UPI002DB8828B|nr:helix-turn-helix domain-containing protein [Nocardia sp. CDC160]MEC3919812.1 helix-turn-helix domain-containing protein [Nocardia sp. CDC160]